MFDLERNELIVSAAVAAICDRDTILAIATAAVKEYETAIADIGPSTTHLYRLLAQRVTTSDGDDLGTLTMRVATGPHAEPTAWQVWLGTWPEIEARLRAHSEEDHAATN